MTELSVNIDHVATVREARGVSYPDPVDAARIAEDAGASGITVHLRSDRRHIQDDDVRRLAPIVRGKLNLEIAATDEMLAIALELKPGQVTLVPERPEEVTTEGGLDLVRRATEIAPIAQRLQAAGIAVSFFLDPELAQIDALGKFKAGVVQGFEINTDQYTKAVTRGSGKEAEHDLRAIAKAIEHGSAAGFEIYAGHGLTVENVGPIVSFPEVLEVNIGHSIVSRAVLIGMDAAVREMLTAIASGAPKEV